MRKTYCDRCGEEITTVLNATFKDARYTLPDGYRSEAGNATPYTAPRWHDFRKDLELCEACFYEVMEYATTKPIEDTGGSVEVDVPGKPDETTEIAACCYGCDNCCEPGQFHGNGDYVCSVATGVRVPWVGRECPWWVPKQEGGF